MTPPRRTAARLPLLLKPFTSPVEVDLGWPLACRRVCPERQAVKCSSDDTFQQAETC
jgi:hypothetical protein